jgi:D-lyxose ketol-isomerase
MPRYFHGASEDNGFISVCECGRTVEKLHAYSDRPWRCRHCYLLTYGTRQAVPRHRHVIKVQKIREQLGGSLRFARWFSSKAERHASEAV